MTRGETEDPERWFRVDAVRAGLRAHSVRSGAIALGVRGAQILLSLGAVVVLARMLRPEDFGVLAMVLPITILVNGIINIGLQNTVIHDDALDHTKASALFRRGARNNLALASLMALAGVPLVWIYDDARAGPLAAAWATVLYLASLSAVHEALLKRQMRFGSILSASLAGLAIGVALAIAAAAMGAGHWALLLQFATMDLFRAGAAWRLCDWRPSLHGAPGDDASIAKLRAYWRNFSAFRCVHWLGEHPDRILVGRVAGAGTLGLYDSARRWAFYPVVELFVSLSDVAVATFSRVAHDANRYRSYVLRGLLPVLALPLPAVAFVFAETRSTVLVLLGDQWLGAVPFVRLMCVAAFFGSLARFTTWLFLSRGQTDRQLRWALFVRTPVMLACVLFGTRWGAPGIATGFAAGTAVLALPALAYALHDSPLRLADVLAVAARPALASLTSVLLLGVLAPTLPVFGAMPDLILRLVFFCGVYALIWLSLPGGQRATAQVLEALRELRPDRTPAVVAGSTDSGTGSVTHP